MYGHSFIDTVESVSFIRHRYVFTVVGKSLQLDKLC